MTALSESIPSAGKRLDQVKEFLTQFKDKAGAYKYVEEIDQMMAKKTQYLVVDYNDLVSNAEIESVFNKDPDEILHAFADAINDVLKERFPQYAEKIQYDVRVRISNYPAQRSLREINAEIIGKMTSVSGMVVRSSEIKPLAKELVYLCPEGHETRRTQEKGLEFNQPLKCDNGKCTHKDLELSPERSRFIDFQMVRLQELPEDLPPGQLPHYVDVTVLQDLVDNARPGDRVILTGIVRIEQEHIPSMRGKSGIYR
ncbi:MAG: minichromosome maintenance protein MCM, partial [Nitrosopumilaceae archaeon]